MWKHSFETFPCFQFNTTSRFLRSLYLSVILFSSNIFMDFCGDIFFVGFCHIPVVLKFQGPKKLSGPSLLNQHYNRLELVSCDALMLIPKSRGLFANCVQIATLEVTRLHILIEIRNYYVNMKLNLALLCIKQIDFYTE